MSEVVNVLNGAGIMVALPVPNLNQEFEYDGSGNLITITVVYQTETYIQTLTWEGGNMTNITPFVVQT